jgi:hypothetical protein
LEGWIKWHRKIIDNEIWRNDPTAWRIFEYLLAVADYKTGEVNRAQSTMVEFLGIPQSTLRDALHRLETAGMTHPTPHPNYTTYSILNWEKYQGDAAPLTALKPHPDRTYTRSKEIKKGNSKIFSLPNETETMAELQKSFPRLEIEKSRQDWQDYYTIGTGAGRSPCPFRTWAETDATKFHKNLRPMTIREEIEATGEPLIETDEDARKYLEKRRNK